MHPVLQKTLKMHVLWNLIVLYHVALLFTAVKMEGLFF